jgi:FXSXX-COOH protein
MDTFEPGRVLPGLVDVTGMPLADLWSLPDDSVLGHALRQVTAPVDEPPNQSVSAFGSAI